MLMVLAGVAQPLAAQTDSAWRASRPAQLPLAQEIALARSAAPPEVSRAATVLVRRSGRYDVASEGTNGVTCYVARSWPESIEPHCFDAEGAATILPIHLREAELQEQGQSRAEIERDRDEGLRTGRFHLPTRPAMTYMMSSGQILFDDDGKPVGKWHPHLMIYVPYITSTALGLGEPPSTKAAVVVDEGSPTANIMIVLPQFVDPEPPGSSPDPR